MKRAAFVVGLAACGGSTPTPVTPPPGDDTTTADAAPGDAAAETGGPDVVSLKGKLSADKISKALAPHLPAMQAGYRDEVGSRRWLGGAISIKWFVDQAGAVEQAQLAESDLGAWPIEKCILGVAGAVTFPAPSGGATDFALPIEFPARTQPLWWDEDRGNATVSKRVAELAVCAGAPSDALVTVYVGSRGKVESVGFAAGTDDGVDPAWADCAAAKISAWLLSDPKGKVAKLAFRYPGQF